MKCQCSEPGWCQTHRRTMGDNQFANCQRSDAFFDGLQRLGTKSTGLGDVVAKVTRATGVQRVAKAVAKVRGKPCGCGKRQDALNEMLPFRTVEVDPPESPADGQT